MIFIIISNLIPFANHCFHLYSFNFISEECHFYTCLDNDKCFYFFAFIHHRHNWFESRCDWSVDVIVFILKVFTVFRTIFDLWITAILCRVHQISGSDVTSQYIFKVTLAWNHETDLTMEGYSFPWFHFPSSVAVPQRNQQASHIFGWVIYLHLQIETITLYVQS